MVGELRPVNKDGYIRANGLKECPRQPKPLEFKTTNPHGNAENTGPYGVTSVTGKPLPVTPFNERELLLQERVVAASVGEFVNRRLQTKRQTTSSR